MWLIVTILSSQKKKGRAIQLLAVTGEGKSGKDIYYYFTVGCAAVAQNRGVKARVRTKTLCQRRGQPLSCFLERRRPSVLFPTSFSLLCERTKYAACLSLPRVDLALHRTIHYKCKHRHISNEPTEIIVH